MYEGQVERNEVSGYKIVSVVLAIILAATLAISYISYSNLESRYLQLRGEYFQAREEYMRLQDEYSSLKRNYTEISTSYKQLEDRYARLSGDYEALNLEFKSLEDRLREREEEYRVILGKYGELQEKHSELAHEYELLKNMYENLLANYTGLSMNYTLLLAGLGSIGINTSNIDELWKLREVTISKTYLIYNYDSGRWEWYFWRQIPVTYYLHERTRIIHEPMTLEERVAKYSETIVREYAHDPMISDVANFLWGISGGDGEKFVNYVLEIVHQMPYIKMIYAKSPIETLIEGTGDCDNVAMLAASIIESKGLDTILIYGVACGRSGCGPHVMIGVALPNPPDDLLRFGRTSYWYIEHNGRRYYVAECTPVGGDVRNFDNPEIVGFFVGDNPWMSFEVKYVVDVGG